MADVEKSVDKFCAWFSDNVSKLRGTSRGEVVDAIQTKLKEVNGELGSAGKDLLSLSEIERYLAWRSGN